MTELDQPDLHELTRLLPDPAPHDLPGDRHRSLRETFMDQIEQTKPAPVRSAAGKRRPWRLWVPATVGALVVAMWLTSAYGLGVGKFWAGYTAAGHTLSRIALAAEESPEPVPTRDDQFVYVETYGGWGGWGAGGWQAVAPHKRQIWLSADGSHAGLLVEPTQPRPTPIDPYPGSLNAPNYRYLTTLPTNPDMLLAKIYTETWGSGQSRQQEAFATIGDLIRESIVPTDIASAIYMAAARIPGVEVVEDATDALGRHGIAIARTDSGLRTELIFDKSSLQFLGEREVVTDPQAVAASEGSATPLPAVGTVLGSAAVVTRGVVDHPGDLPN